MLPLLFLLTLAQPAPPQAKPTPPSQLTIDDSFAPPVDTPDFEPGKGPLVMVDEAHRNVISLATYLRPVGQWLRTLGYRIEAFGPAPSAEATAFAPRQPDIVVIANAQAPEGAAPGTSAFSDAEVKAIHQWVQNGGGLLLVADRAPFGAPARALAKPFGVTLDDNTILTKGADGRPNGDLTIDVPQGKTHAILSGVSRIKFVVGESINGPGIVMRAPTGTYGGPTADATEGPSTTGRPIVLAFRHGKGRVVVIGDGGVVSAFGSVDGSARRGISEADNARFVRNVFRWLAEARGVRR